MSAAPPAIDVERIPDAPRALPTTDVLIGRIGWLVRLRWLGVLGPLLFVEVARRFLAITIDSTRLYGVLATLALCNALFWLVLRRGRRSEGGELSPTAPPLPRERLGALARFLLPRTPAGVAFYNRRAGHAATFALVQIVLDLVLLAALLHFTGGIENPLWVFFSFHIIIASVLLARHATYAVATLGAVLLCGVALGEAAGVLAHYPPNPDWLQPGLFVDTRLVLTYLFLQVATLFAIAYLASSIAARLRRREMDVLVLSRHLSDRAKRLEKAHAELRVVERAKSQYMRKVAHELRQPLGTIKTALTVALDAEPGTLPPVTHDLIARAERRVGELADTTRELLSLARARGGPVIDLAPVNLRALAASLLDDAKRKAAAAGVDLRVEIAERLPEIVGDAEGLADLVVNLVGNAIRYTPAGGVVHVRFADAGTSVALEVEDEGIGIPAGDLPRIFDEFFRATNARARAPQGSGLGLAIVKAVVDQHGGDIEVESAEGAGTRFRVALPVAHVLEPV